jgi:hypothetical protein
MMFRKEKMAQMLEEKAGDAYLELPRSLHGTLLPRKIDISTRSSSHEVVRILGPDIK